VNRATSSRARGLALVVAALTGIALGAAAALTGGLAGLERDALRARFDLRGAERPGDVVVVAVDEPSFGRLGLQWPFPRRLHARAIDRLKAAGARTIVYDVQFTEPSTLAQDEALFEAVARAGNVVLVTTETDGRGQTNVLGGDANVRAARARVAASNLSPEPGGNVTRVPYAAGGLRSVAATLGAGVTPRSAFAGDGARIDFRGPPGTIPTMSFADVVDGRGRFDPALVRGRVVVVGASAASLQDVHPTPMSSERLMSGPEVQANAIWTALHGAPLRDAPPAADWVLLALLGALVPCLRLRRGLLVAVLGGLVGAVAFAVGAQVAFEAGVVLAVVPPLVALVGAAVATIAVSALAERSARRHVARDNALLEERVRERTRELEATQLEVVQRLGRAAEWKDTDTGEHIERIGRLVEELASAIGLPPGQAALLRHASAMHDVGKIGIPDQILHKPGRLDDDERAVMERHADIGAAILAGSSSPLLQLAEQIARTHHERWDGTGYPVGLAGEDIPLGARICAVADVFDALISRRPYKEPWTMEEALAELRAQRGRHFDPRLVDAFMGLDLRRFAGQNEADAPAPVLAARG
jgi:CHASE2 domain-containing sensor protein